MHRSYVPKEWIDSFVVNNAYPLPKEASSRFFSVLRIKTDEQVAVFDGCGREVVGLLGKDAGQNAIFLHARLHMVEPSKPRIVLLQAAIEETKLSQTIQRGTEFGVDHVVIFSADRSDHYCFSKLEKRCVRFERIAQDAARQSHRLYIPTLAFLPTLNEALRTFTDAIGFFGDVQSKVLLSTALSEQQSFDGAIFLAVGPEGGFSRVECDRLKQAGFLGVQWAPYVLRTELACLGGIAIINAFCGRA